VSQAAAQDLFSPEPIRHALPEGESLDALLLGLPEDRAVFRLDAAEGQQPYLGRCQNLRRRLQRLLRPATPDSRMLSLRGIAQSLCWWPIAGQLSGALLLWGTDTAY
jgi:hypothetical protein